MLKYTINFDGMFATSGSIHHQECYASEALALPENVMNHFKKEKDHACVYILDRGQNSAEAYKEIKAEDGLLFVGRLIESRQIKLVKELSVDENGLQVILYMTMITAMLVMIYKKENETGCKTAIMRMGIEIENLVLAIVVIQSGGELRKTDLPAP